MVTLLPTGFGKSFIYQYGLFGFLLIGFDSVPREDSALLVVSLLSAVMSEELNMLMTSGKTDKLESDDDEDPDSEQFNDRKSKWYIEKNGSLIHLKKALKLLIPREFISKERSRRHWVTNSLHTSLKPIGPTHDVIQFRDVAIDPSPKWRPKIQISQN